MSTASSLGLALPAPRLPSRIASAQTGSTIAVLLHLTVATAVVLAAARGTSVVTSRLVASGSQTAPPPRMVFLLMPQAGGGGGGGGTRDPLPPPRARNPGRDHLALPAVAPLLASEQLAEVPPPEQAMLDAVPLALGTTLLTGLPEARPSPALSGGPGIGGGIGAGTGTGLGSGAGPGLGPGFGGGFGGGAYRPGGAVIAPTLLRQVLPKYTPEALERKIQGTVVLEVVVGRDGVPAAIRVARSLDAGLDAEAVAAVREWRFTPGRLGDAPVDVLVSIWVDFRVV